jgi:hypothetical protein
VKEPVAQAIGVFLFALAPAPVPFAFRVGAIVLAAVLVPFGVWMLWGGRDFSPKPLDDHLHPPPPPRTRLHGFRESLTRASRTTLGLCAIIVAYHAVAYTHPRIDLMQVPIERWWVLALGVLIAVWASIGMDRWFR